MLSKAETFQLIQAIAGEGKHGTRSGGKLREHGLARPASAEALPSPEREKPLVALGDFLFAQTRGQPLYLLETLKLLREREWLVPRLAADGAWRLELGVELAPVVAQERFQRELLPPSVRAMIMARLWKLTQPARQLVMTSAVLGTQASAKLLWQVAEVEAQTGVEALEEAIGSGMLREEEAGGPGVGNLGSYGFFPDLMREGIFTELGAARRP